MISLTVHIGFPKTGTTALQNHVFPRLKTYRYLTYNECVELFADLQFADDLNFDSEVLKAKLQILQDEAQKPLFASLESLVGYLFHPSGFNRTRNIVRLAQVSDNLKLIITTRDTIELLDAVYRQYVQKGGVLKPSGLYVTSFKYDSHQRIHLNFFRQIEFLDWLKSHDGISGVLEVKFEELRTDVSKVEKELSRFLEESVDLEDTPKSNVSLSNSGIAILRYINIFISTFLRPLPTQIVLFNGQKWRYGVQDYLDPLFRKLGAKKKNYIQKSPELHKKVQQFFQT